MKKTIIAHSIFLLLFTSVSYAFESFFPVFNSRYGYDSIPFGIEYRRDISPSLPKDTDPATAILYTPNAKCKLFADGKGNFLYFVNREYPSGVDNVPFSEYIYSFSKNDAIKYTPARRLIEILDSDFDKNRDPFILNYITGFSSPGIGSNFVDINNIISSDKNNISIKKNENNAVISLRVYDGKAPGNADRYYLYTLEIGKISGKFYPLKSCTKLLVASEDNKETIFPAMSEITYEDYIKLGNQNIYMPQKIIVSRYKITATPNDKEFKRELFERETIKITKVFSDSKSIEENMKLTIPESVMLFNKKDGNAYSFPGIIKMLKESMDAK